MTANTSATSTESTVLVTSFAIYGVLGVCSVLGNTLVVASIVRQKELRKKYVLQVALAGGHWLNGVGYVAASAMRITDILNGHINERVSRLECAERVYSLLFIMGTDVPSLIDLLISIDRLVAIAHPMHYYQARKTRYALVASAVVYAFCFVSMWFVFVAAVADTSPDGVDNMCIRQDAEGLAYSVYDNVISLVSDTAACVIYVVAVGLLVRQTRRLNNDAIALRRLQRQVAMTKMMAIVIGLSFFLFILPNAGFIALSAIDDHTATLYVTPVFGSMIALNSAVNVLIYAAKNGELRSAFVATLRCRRRPLYARNASARNIDTSTRERQTSRTSMMSESDADVVVRDC